MILVLVFVLGAAAIAVGGVLVHQSRAGFDVVMRLLRRPTLAVSALHEGPVEVSGKISAATEPLGSLTGHRCIAVTRTVDGRRGTGKHSKPMGTTTTSRSVPALLTDATGTCRLDLDLSQIVGQRWTTHLDAGSFDSLPSGLVPPGSDNVDIEEVIVPEGATVLASGDATEEMREADGYRDDRTTQWVLAGTADQLLLLSVGGQGWLLTKTIAVAGFVFLAGTGLIVTGTLALAIVVVG
ncbi:MAG TPA: hypothetical protein VF407_18660 [Polyangiaceae bacterium]